MKAVFLEGAARWLLVLHALAAMALLGSATHLALGAISALRGGPRGAHWVRTHSVVTAALFAFTLGLGLLMYPHYRVHVRGWVLDRDFPWASNLFDIKENLVALAIPLGACVLVFGRAFKPDQAPRVLLTFCALALWAVVAFAVVSGLWVTSVKGI